MRKIIIFCTILKNHPLAIPEETSREIVEFTDESKLQEYIESKTDGYGHFFRKIKTGPELGFAYISNAGGVKIKDFKQPKIKKL